MMVDQISMSGETSTAVSQSVERPRIENAVSGEQKPKFDPTQSLEKMQEIVQVANAAMDGANNSLRFQVDESLSQPIVSVVDQNTGDVIRQLPSEEIVRISRGIESMRGILFDSMT
jgi:flagellar protein FlaG